MEIITLAQQCHKHHIQTVIRNLGVSYPKCEGLFVTDKNIAAILQMFFSLKEFVSQIKTIKPHFTESLLYRPSFVTLVRNASKMNVTKVKQKKFIKHKRRIQDTIKHLWLTFFIKIVILGKSSSIDIYNVLNAPQTSSEFIKHATKTRIIVVQTYFVLIFSKSLNRRVSTRLLPVELALPTVIPDLLSYSNTHMDLNSA